MCLLRNMVFLLKTKKSTSITSDQHGGIHQHVDFPGMVSCCAFYSSRFWILESPHNPKAFVMPAKAECGRHVLALICSCVGFVSSFLQGSPRMKLNVNENCLLFQPLSALFKLSKSKYTMTNGSWQRFPRNPITSRFPIC